LLVLFLSLLLDELLPLLLSKTPSLFGSYAAFLIPSVLTGHYFFGGAGRGVMGGFFGSRGCNGLSGRGGRGGYPFGSGITSPPP